MNDKNNKLSEIAKDELKILDFWKKNNIFELAQGKNSKKDFIFYDGPPFANGSPHHGHILPGTVKDIIPRYKTMKGFNVKRKWGWDCHGVPLETEVQKEFGLKSKQDIEIFGIDKFNKKARELVFSCKDQWESIIPRTGRWVDMKNAYVTMDNNYIESIWWSFNKLYKKKLIYESFESVQISPILETEVSKTEASQNYQSIKDYTLIVKFPIRGRKKNYFLAWTTTPWTLPGNAALAVNPNLMYSKIQFEGENYYVSSNVVSSVFESKDYKIIEEVSGNDLIGFEYKQPFDYFKEKINELNGKNLWKVYPANFVNEQDGTGIVHIAPAFGQDDFLLSKKFNIPIIKHVEIDGRFSSEVKDFSGYVKPLDNHQEADRKIAQKLDMLNLVFKSEEYEHTYPFCDRTKWPLLNYVSQSWFVDVPKVKNELYYINKFIKWYPKNIGQKRFANLLKTSPNWSISRQRYWGAPLPVWKSQSGKIEVLGSLEDLKSKLRSANRFFIMRHGETVDDVKNFISGQDDNRNHLTNKGKFQSDGAFYLIQDLYNKVVSSDNTRKIDLIYVSPAFSCRQTSLALSKFLKLSKDQIIIDKRIDQRDLKEFSFQESKVYFNSLKQGIKLDIETDLEVRKRVLDFLQEIDSNNRGKNILIVTHKSICISIFFSSQYRERDKNFTSYNIFNDFAKPFIVDFVKLPHNEDYLLDLHRPNIDKVTWFDKKYGLFRRINSVFDCWYESGSVPFASFHYPFASSFNSIFSKRSYPADFICEGIDQTRGWFNRMLILNYLLFKTSPFKNVVVTGHILARDGKKLSKSLKNYPELNEILDIYGADAFRLFLMSSSAVSAGEVSLNEKEIDDVMKKNIIRLKNILSFLNIYKDNTLYLFSYDKLSILDKWIILRTKITIEEIDNSLNKYDLSKAARVIPLYIEDLSTWYLRRIKSCFKSNLVNDLQIISFSVLYFCLRKFSKAIAPIMPFISEIIWQELKSEYLDDKDSIHLEDWPEIKIPFLKRFNFNKDILLAMDWARKIVSLSLEARAISKIKVRQPLRKITILDEKKYLIKYPELALLIKDEINVKEIEVNIVLNNNQKVILDTDLDEVLIEEGELREIVRIIQGLRKSNKLSLSNNITISFNTEFEGLILKNINFLKSRVGIMAAEFDLDNSLTDKRVLKEINGKVLVVEIKKVH